jgi:hypothetical protein
MVIQSGRQAVRRWSWWTTLVVGVVIAILGGTSASAVAGPTGIGRSGASADECPFTGTLCLFDGTNYTGERFTVISLVSPGTCVSLVQHGWANRAHSAINTNGNNAAMFMIDNCVGGPFLVLGNSRLPDFGGFTPASVWVPR